MQLKTTKMNIIFSWILLILALFFFYEVRQVLFPFIISFVFAYLLNPIVNRIKKYFSSRTTAAAITILCFFTLIIIIFISVFPVIYYQISNFIYKAPQYKTYIQHQNISSLAELFSKIDEELQAKIQAMLGAFSSTVFKYLSYIIHNLWQSGVLLLNVLSFLFLTPVITFYLLRDWPLMINRLENLIPEHYKALITNKVNEIDKILSSYLHGQMNVCLLMAVYYSIGFTALGLEYGVLIGLTTGIFTFIAYLGPIFGIICALLLAVLQSMPVANILGLIAVYGIGQVIEGNFLTPRFVGDKIGLHPVTMLFVLFAGGAIFGLIGIIIAVPVAAILGVFGKLLIEQYYASNFYKHG